MGNKKNSCFGLMIIFSCVLLSCKNETKKNLPISIEQKNKLNKVEIDTNSFLYFENLVKTNEDIPNYLIKKFFKNVNQYFNIDSSIIFGKDFFIQNKNKLLFLKQRDRKIFTSILLSFNPENSLIDFKIFEVRCKECETPLLIKELIYSHAKNPLVIEVWQFKLKKLAMPNLDNDEVILKEKYVYQNNGIFSEKIILFEQK